MVAHDTVVGSRDRSPERQRGVRNRGRRIIFENRGTKKAYVNKIKAGTEGRLSNDVFVVVGAGGERVLFAGIPAGRVGGLQHYGVFCLPVPAACFSD